MLSGSSHLCRLLYCTVVVEAKPEGESCLLMPVLKITISGTLYGMCVALCPVYGALNIAHAFHWCNCAASIAILKLPSICFSWNACLV